VKKTYTVTGMSCANCVANVERAVKKVEGIKKVDVNLIEEMMLVEYDEAIASDDEIIAAVKKAGYGASVNGTSANSSSQVNNTDGEACYIACGCSCIKEGKSKESKNSDSIGKGQGAGLIASVILMIILMVIAMFVKWDAATNALTQFILVIPVIIINRRFFINAFKALRNGGTNMDVLVSLGSICSLGYSLYGLYNILISLENGDSEHAMHLSHNLYFDSTGMILTLVSVGKFLESRSKGKTKDAINSLLDIVPKKIVRIKTNADGSETEETISQSEVRKGDIILISKGEAASVDGRVVFGNAVFDESAITGESEAVKKSVGDEVISASMVMDGYVRVQAEAVGEESTLRKIVRMTREAGATKAPIARLADKIASIFVPAILAIAAITFVVWIIISKDFTLAFSNAISVLVISCPCALGLATPVAITVGMGMGAKRGILFKSAESLERLKSVEVAVFDKTGTITEGTVSVEGEVRKDTIRKTSRIAMDCLKGLGIKTMMLSGDKKDKALAIAKEAGVDEVKYELKPEDKARIVNELKAEGKKVLMVGDGINDAPALASAEVGMAMGAGKDIAIDSADVVLMHSDLLDVVRAIRLSKSTLLNIKENLFWAFFYNILMIPVAAGVAYPLFGIKLNPMIGAACMSLSSICVCLNAIRLMSFNIDKDIERYTKKKATNNVIDEIDNSVENKEINNNEMAKEDKEAVMISFGVEGMMCEHCKARVENALKEISGVTNAVADLEKKSVSVEADASVSEQALKDAVVAAGYKVI
jgi:copper ion binding protein